LPIGSLEEKKARQGGLVHALVNKAAEWRCTRYILCTYVPKRARNGSLTERVYLVRHIYRNKKQRSMELETKGPYIKAAQLHSYFSA
jgi:hypothetical protein